MMTNKLTIKTKLLISSLFIQALTLIIFSYSMYKLLEYTTFDKIQSNVKIITLDIIDDITHQKKLLNNIDLEEAEEFKIKPLYIRITELKSLKPIVSTRFPKSLLIEKEAFEGLKKEDIKIEKTNGYIVSRTKISIKNKVDLIIEVATTQNILNSTLDNILSILFIVVPIVFVFSITGTILLLNKSFQPIKNILSSLKNIQSTNLSERIKRNNTNDEIDLLSKEINSLIDRLEDSFNNIKQFSSDASHELKTPLTIIRGELEVTLKKDRTKEEYKKVLESSLNEVIIIQQTINDLLFLSKSEFKNKEKEEIYLDEITIDAIQELKYLSDSKKVKVLNRIEEPLQIFGYSHLLKVAIKNVIKNAIEFSYEESEVIVKNYTLNEKKIIEIEDKGIGISKQEQNKIFEQFYRTDKSRDKKSGGLGLGMAIFKKIIDIHNGNIIITSKENLGTIIRIEFL